MNRGKILSNNPCNADLFEGKAHEKLARVIADEIIKDENCTIIGIDGCWGSGKSNLVGMVEKCLTEGGNEDNKKYHFFTYDAWGHQNDLQRRSILEELTINLTHGENAILDEKIWKDKLDNLLAKKKKTSTKTVPSLNFAIVTIALMTAFTPVISAIAGQISSQTWRLIVTAVIYFGAISFIVLKQISSLKKHEQKVNLENFFSELFLLYKDKITENEKFETISEREPSTKQFITWMEDINKGIKSKDKHLIFVIDNMDRLPKQKVHELWSAIHSFFSETHYSNIKVVVPFDRMHIRNAFQSENIEGKQKDEVKLYGDDFINKTFYVVYHVAPPILSGWKQYFEYQWEAAFGEDYPLDSTVLQIYDMLTEDHSPRKIVAFINEFVIIKGICDDTIPDRYIALFIFGRSAISAKPMTEILSPSYLGSLEFMYKEDKDMAGYISSLFYQLPVTDAIDIVYLRQFTKELDANTPDSIKQMKVSGNRKFFAILSRAIAEIHNTENATLALHTVFGNESTAEIQNSWNCLYQMDRDSQHDRFSQYHKILLTHIRDKSQFIKHLIRGYHSGLNEYSDIKEYMLGIDELSTTEGIDLYGMLERIHKAITPTQFITLVGNAGKEYKKYGLSCNDTVLSDHLRQQDIFYWEKLTIIPDLDRNEYPLSSYKSKIEADLKSSNLTVVQAKVLFSRLKELRDDNKTIKYKDYFQDITLDNLFHSAQDEFRYDLIAMRLSSLGNFSTTSYNYINNFLNSNYGEPIVCEVAKVSSCYVSYGELLASLGSYHIPFMKSLCKYLTLNKNGTQTMNIVDIAKKFDTIISNSDISNTELFIRMDDWNKYKESIQVSDVPSIPCSFFKAAKFTDCELSEYVLDLALQYLQSISQEEWANYLKTTKCFQFDLLGLHHPERIQPFFDAFKALLKSYASGETTEQLSIARADSIICIAEEMEHDVKRLFMDIRDIFLNSGITAAKLKYFGKWLFKYARLEYKSGCLEKILPSEILDDDEVIQLMEINKDVVKGMVGHAVDASEFYEKLKSMMLGSKKNNSQLRALCDFLGL